MCMTFMHVPKLVWIIIEDSYSKTELVTSVLERCRVESVHLNYRTSEDYRIKFWLWSLFTFSAKGVEQRNTGLEWLRSHCSPHNCTGVVYFGDDDNKYDLRVFDEVSLLRVTRLFLSFPTARFNLMMYRYVYSSHVPSPGLYACMKSGEMSLGTRLR